MRDFILAALGELITGWIELEKVRDVSMKTPLSLALMLCALSPFHALASAPFRTANCDPQNPSHIAAKEAMRRAALNPNSDDFTCWVYVAAVQDDAQGESEWASILVMNKQWEEAFAWSEKSARQDNPDGAWILSELYRTGKGTQINLERAQYWRTTALKDPSVRARAGMKDGASTAPPATVACNPNNHSPSGYREGLKKAVAENNPSDAICWVYIGAGRCFE